MLGSKCLRVLLGKTTQRTAQGHIQKLFDFSSEKYEITLCELSNRYFFPRCKAIWVQNVASICKSKKLKLPDHCWSHSSHNLNGDNPAGHYCPFWNTALILGHITSWGLQVQNASLLVWKSPQNYHLGHLLRRYLLELSLLIGSLQIGLAIPKK